MTEDRNAHRFMF